MVSGDADVAVKAGINEDCCSSSQICDSFEAISDARLVAVVFFCDCSERIVQADESQRGIHGTSFACMQTGVLEAGDGFQPALSQNDY